MEVVWLLVVAFVMDWVFGDPVYRYHPVAMMGRLAERLEAVLYDSMIPRVWGGAILVAVTAAVGGVVYLLVRSLVGLVFPSVVFLWDVFIMYSCISLNDLLSRAERIETALRVGDLVRGRMLTAEIVGRDTSVLDERGLVRAVVESVSENLVDGFVAPLFWFAAASAVSSLAGGDAVVAGILAVVLFRTVNTMDAMVGYENERYALFGRAAAFLDDLANFLPARLSVPLVSLAALLCGMDARRCLSTALRDRLKHPSPNSGHPEACFAGALHIRLGGPNVYGGRVVEKPWLGAEFPSRSHTCIPSARLLAAVAGGLAALLSIVSVYIAVSVRLSRTV